MENIAKKWLEKFFTPLIAILLIMGIFSLGLGIGSLGILILGYKVFLECVLILGVCFFILVWVVALSK